MEQRKLQPSGSRHPLSAIVLLGVALSVLTPMHAELVWKVRVEEPTGLYRRSQEVVSVPFSTLKSRIPGEHPDLAALSLTNRSFAIVDPQGKELPWQATADALLFPVSLIPGELPEYTVAVRTNTSPTQPFVNQVQVRRIGMHRVELGNDRFRMLIDVQIPAIVEAYSLTAGPQRMLNLVETTPESPEALKTDIHAAELSATMQQDVVTGENSGWTTFGGHQPMHDVEILENGPLRGRIRLSRPGETWELVWDAHSAALRWKASRGYRFAAISAEPYLPFDRFQGGSEYEWPTGPDSGDPPDTNIGPRKWDKLPGGHVVYYRNDENYGVLGIVTLDPDLIWKGVGSRRFEAEKTTGSTEIALTFPRWDRGNTVLEARKEARILRQPVLVTVTAAQGELPAIRETAERNPATELKLAEKAPAQFEPERLALSGEWELMWAEKGQGPPVEGWRTVRVPGSAHTQWLEPAQIYSHEAEWVSGKEWWYRRKFRVPESFRGKHLRLQFEATDYYADIYLNDTWLGRHEGYMDPFEFEVTGKAQFGEDNELRVRVWTPVDYYWKHRPYTIKGSYGAVDQKPDDITALGITRPVWLRASSDAWLGKVAVATPLIDEHHADVEVDLELVGKLDPDAPLQWELTLAPRNFTGSRIYALSAPATQWQTHLRIPVANPALWWTWDHGKPNLYTLDIRLLDAARQPIDGQAVPVGIREIEKVGWQFYLNRKRFFVRGSNYYYHLYMSEMNRAKYERDLTLMLGMNINLLRLHCHFSNPELYDLADEKGLLLWQDYLEAWYPEDRAFSLRAAQLYDPLICSVRNHPSVALWTTCDEESLENYRDLTKHLAPRPAWLDPQRRPIVRSTGRYGDAHVYHGWYGGSIWEYTKMTEEFVSELGATSLPNYETLQKYMPGQWPIREHEQEWFFRRLQIPEAMQAWGDPTGLTLQEYIPRTQSYVARLFQIALERMRRIKYNPAGGVLHFHAIDIWPSVTMAAIDFDRVPTKVYDTVRRSFAPVLASIEFDRDQWPEGAQVRCGIWAVNDNWEAIPDARVAWFVQDSRGQQLGKGEWPLTIPEDSTQRLGETEWTAARPGSYQLHAQVRNASDQLLSENIFEFEVTPGRR